MHVYTIDTMVICIDTRIRHEEEDSLRNLHVHVLMLWIFVDHR
jgi:hypothetical protein